MSSASGEQERVETAALARAAARARRIGQPAFDAAVGGTTARLRKLGIELEEDGEQVVAMAEAYTTSHGGSLRTFAGNLDHENGWWPSYKRRRNQHWEGMAQHDALVMHEASDRTLWAQTESHRLEFTYKGRRRKYTNDLLVQTAWGQPEIWELKRDERDLEDGDYRDTLAGACEIWRRCGHVFRIVFADELFANRHHNDNCRLVASRRFASVGPEHLGRLARLAGRRPSGTTWGELADALEPDFRPAGLAVAQALVVRRRVRVDLTARLDEHTPVTINPTVRGAR